MSNLLTKVCRIFPDLKYHTFLFVKFSLLEKLAVIVAQSSRTLSLTVQIKIALTKSKPDRVTLHTTSKIVFVNTTPVHVSEKTRHLIRMRNRLLFRRHYGSENNQISHQSTPCSITRNALEFRKLPSSCQ